MVSDSTKDQIEDTTASVVEALVSLVPIVGGPAAVLVNRTFGLAVQRRNEKLMAQFEADIQTLAERQEARPEELIHSEPFMAALHMTFRAAQETSSDEKRKLLRNALLNGYVLPDPDPSRDDFLGLVIRYEPGHVLLLDALRMLMVGRGELLEHASTQTLRKVGESGGTVPNSTRYFNEMVRDGLISESSEGVVTDASRPDRYGRTIEKETIKTTTWHSDSDRGKAFLAFVADPLAV